MLKKKKILGIILARKGSRRLKNKNILNFFNKPLIYWTLKTALKSKFIDDIIVSTDSPRVKSISKNFKNVIIHNRKKKLSQSKSKSEDAIIDIFKCYKFNHDYFILLQPTSPLRTVNDIDLSIKKIIYTSANNCISVQPLAENTDKIYKIRNNKLKKISKRSLKAFMINGAIYISKVKIFLKQNRFVDENTTTHIMKTTSSIDIDTIEDLRIAEFIMKKKLLK